MIYLKCIERLHFCICSILSISICGFDYGLKTARTKELSSETHQSIVVLRNESYCMRGIPKKLKISYKCVHFLLSKTSVRIKTAESLV